MIECEPKRIPLKKFLKVAIHDMAVIELGYSGK